MRKLKIIKKKHSGRDVTGSVSVRHQGGEHKRYYRIIDFKRNKIDVAGKVVGIEYDPNRTAELALIQYVDGEKRYILRPVGLNIDDVIKSGKDVEVKVGNALPLNVLPLGTVVHSVELTPGNGAQLARGAGTYATVSAKEGVFVHLRLPSGEIRRVRGQGFATVGTVGNIEWKNEVMGTAGRRRRMGIRPVVRGVAQNPRSHPHGGGEARSGIGMSTPKTYAGRKSVGRTRDKKKYSNKYIIQRRKN